MNTVEEAPASAPSADLSTYLDPVLTLAGALLDPDRLGIMARLLHGPASRLELSAHTGLGERPHLRVNYRLRESNEATGFDDD